MPHAPLTALPPRRAEPTHGQAYALLLAHDVSVLDLVAFGVLVAGLRRPERQA